MIDTHCHLNFKAFKGKVRQVIEQAKKVGITKIIVPGTNLETSKEAVNLAQKYKEIYAAVGIHPHHASQVQSSKFKVQSELSRLAEYKKVVAIGECGLDYYKYQKTKYKDYEIDEDFKKAQRQIFEMQIKLAQELNLPLIIHNRQASNDILKILNTKYSIPNTGVLHCFQGNDKLLNWAVKQSFYIGITGIVTYNKKMEEVVKKTPLKNLFIETDAPYLMPEPLRTTKRWPNEPKNVKIIAQKIADIKSDSFLEVTKQTTENAIQLFKLF